MKLMNQNTKTQLTVSCLIGGKPVLSTQTSEPYHRAKVQMTGGHFMPPSQLSEVKVPLGNGAISVMALIPDSQSWGNSQIQTDLNTDTLQVSFMTPKRSQVNVYVAMHDIDQLAGVTKPIPGLAQIFIRKAGKLTGYAVQGSKLTHEKQTFFTAREPIGVSGLQVEQGSLLEVTGPATIESTWGKTARSLIDNQQVDLPYEQTQSAGRWWVKSQN